MIWFVLFCGIFSWRWVSEDSLLPKTWTAEKELGYTARILEQPELTDSQTIIRQGRWVIKLRGYPEIEVGQKYTFIGRVEPRVILGKITQIVMMDPRWDRMEGKPPSVLEQGVMVLSSWREKMVVKLARYLPEPEAAFAAGILLGVKRQLPSEFYQELVKSGTLHIVAASGYNTTVVAASVMGILTSVVPRGAAIAGGIGAIVFYVILTGGSAAVIRAGVMGVLALSAYYWGRATQAKRLLWVAAGMMLLTQPLMFVDVGFQLSVAATVGLLYLEPWIRERLPLGTGRVKKYFKEYLTPTLAATISTMPVIWLTFGRVSLISPLPNMLVLPLVPMIMFLSTMTVGVGAMVPTLGQGVAWFLYVPLVVMVEVIRVFG